MLAWASVRCSPQLRMQKNARKWRLRIQLSQTSVFRISSIKRPILSAALQWTLAVQTPHGACVSSACAFTCARQAGWSPLREQRDEVPRTRMDVYHDETLATHLRSRCPQWGDWWSLFKKKKKNVMDFGMIFSWSMKNRVTFWEIGAA